MADIAGLVSACAQVDDLRTIDVNSYLKSQQNDWLSSGLPEKIVFPLCVRDEDFWWITDR